MYLSKLTTEDVETSREAAADIHMEEVVVDVPATMEVRPIKLMRGINKCTLSCHQLHRTWHLLQTTIIIRPASTLSITGLDVGTAVVVVTTITMPKEQ